MESKKSNGDIQFSNQVNICSKCLVLQLLESCLSEYILQVNKLFRFEQEQHL